MRTVLVTGANSGIGLETVLEAARKGFRAIGSVRSDAKADVVHAAAAHAGVEVGTVLLDVSDAQRCAAVVEEVRPDALVNNAGYSSTGAIEDVDDAEARALMETMVLAPMRLARLSLPHMREQKWGRIVNVSSIYGVITTPLTGWYQGSKHALEALSDALRMEVASDGIKVVVVEPGGFRTGIWDSATQEIESREGSRFEGAYRRTLSGVRMSQPILGKPERVAKVIVGAISSAHPAPRALVGYDAYAFAALDRLAPTRVGDRIKRIVLGL